MKTLTASIIFGSFLFVGIASAHVVVKPASVPVGAFQTFTVGVPVEKEITTTGLRLEIPAGLNHVTPNVKPGWRIELVKAGENITEIRWSGGRIPAGQRDEFLFSAQVPTEETKLAWKAYQTYADDSVVAWDVDPEEESHDDEEAQDQGPFSITKVVNETPGSRFDFVALALSILALILSAYALSRRS